MNKYRHHLSSTLISICCLILFTSCGSSSSSSGNLPDCGSLTLQSVKSLQASDGTYTDKVTVSWNAPFLWELVDNDGSVGANSSIDVDSDQTIHIAYKELTGSGSNLLHAWKTSGACWQTESIDSSSDSVGQFTDMDITSSGAIHISYYDSTNTTVKHAWRNAGSSTWNTEDVEANIVTSIASTGIAVDSDGIVHMTFKGAAGLRHAWKETSSSSWQAETVTATMGQYAKIDSDSSALYIAYHTSSSGGLGLATKPTGGSWSTQTLDSGNVGLGLDFHIQSTTWNFYYMISYIDSDNDNLKAAWKTTGGGWNIETADDSGDVGFYTSITSSAYPAPLVFHVAYYDQTNSALNHAWKESTASSWNTETLDSDGTTGQWSSIAFNSSTQQAFIAYYNSTNTSLNHAYTGSGITYNVKRRDTIGSGTWTDLSSTTNTSYDDESVTVEQVYEYGVEPQANSYTGDIVTDTGYAAGSEIVDSSAGEWTSIATASDGTLHIAYYDSTNNQLLHAWKATTSTTWSTEVVDNTDKAGKFEKSIVVDSNGILHIAYYIADAGIMDLMHAWGEADGNGWSWSTEAIDTSNQVGLYANMTIDSQDTLYISYFLGSATNDLKFARGVESGGTWTWSTAVVDSADDVGHWTSIAQTDGTNGDLHIAYYDFTHDSLKYALGEWDTLSSSYDWTPETVDDTSTQVGEYTSTFVDGDDRVHISYYDAENDSLKHAWKEGTDSAAWNLETAAAGTSGAFYGKYTSMAVADNGNVYISSYSASSFRLTLTTGVWNTSTSEYDWTTEDVDSPDVGTYNSLIIGTDNFIHISYYDSGNTALKYTSVSP